MGAIHSLIKVKEDGGAGGGGGEGQVLNSGRQRWSGAAPWEPYEELRYASELFPPDRRYGLHPDGYTPKMLIMYAQSEHIHPRTGLKLASTHTDTRRSKAKSCPLALCGKPAQSEACGVFYSSLGAKAGRRSDQRRRGKPSPEKIKSSVSPMRSLH